MEFIWNMDYFSSTGYASLMATVAVLALWLLHFLFRPPPIFIHTALILTIAAFGLAKHNSLSYVNKIQPDLSEQKAEMEARIAEQKQAVIDSREDQVAQIRFAEDAEDEFLDRAGLEEEDLQELDSIREDLVPEWKKEKKSRSATSEDSEGEGMDTTVIDENAEAEPVMMKEADLMRANQYDAWNLKLTQWCILLGLFIAAHDYLRRHNIYREAYSPRRIPSNLANFLTPHPPLVKRGNKPRRSVDKELIWLTQRGDPFIYFTSDQESSEKAIQALSKFTQRKNKPLQLLSSSQNTFSDPFAFENWWHGRASIIVDSPDRHNTMIKNFLDLLEGRKATRAKVHQTAHLVWDIDSPIEEQTLIRLEQLASRTGVSLLLCRE